MVYKLNVTDHADELLDNLVYHLIYRLKSKEAAKHLLDSVESIYGGESIPISEKSGYVFGKKRIL